MTLVAVTLLVSGMILLGVNLKSLRTSFDWVEHSNTVLLQIADIDAKLVGVEMTVRGYALTDDPIFLRYQKYERDHVKLAMDKLATLMVDEAAQARRLENLRATIAKRLALYAHLSGLGPGHAKDVATAITDPAKRRDMLDARLSLNALRDAELQLLTEREKTAADDASRAYDLAVGIVTIAFLLGGLGFTLSTYGRMIG